MTRAWWRAPCPAWVALLVLAGVLAAAWGVMHAVGWREYTPLFSVAIISDAGQDDALSKAAAYAGAHLLLVLVVPALAVAGLILLVMERAHRRSTSRRRLVGQ
jgi:hypothetical protein